jgi:hypothetical protein
MSASLHCDSVNQVKLICTVQFSYHCSWSLVRACMSGVGCQQRPFFPQPSTEPLHPNRHPIPPFAPQNHEACSLGLSATSQQYFSLRTNQPPATSRNQPAVLFSQNKSAPATSHQPTEQADGLWAVGPTAHSRSRGRLAPLPEAKG